MPEEIDGIVVTIRGDASDLESTINNVSGELSRLENIQRNNNAVTTTAERTVSSYGRQLQNTGKSMKELGEGIDTVTKPLQYTAVALAAGGVASAKFAIDFEDSFASVKKTVDGTPEQLDAIKKSIIDMSTVGINGHNAIPMTTDKLNELAAAGGQLGITVDNIADFTEVMAQMETATNLAGEEGAATMARFQNVMGISQSEIRNVGSAIVDLGNNSATTESEIAAMALRMGKYGQTVGMSAADVLGYSAALSSLGIEAQLGGSAIGRTWLSIETAVANGGEELKTFAKYSGKSAKEFKEQWNTDSKGAFNGLLKGLQSAENLTLALDDLGINNTQDIQAMMALVNGYDLVTESVNRANTAYQENTALQEEFNSKSETTASQLAVTKNNIVEAARSIGETFLPTIKDASGGVAEFAQKLASMDDGQKKVLVNTGATIIGLGAISKGFVTITKSAGELKEAAGKILDNKIFNAAAGNVKGHIKGVGATFKTAVGEAETFGGAVKAAFDIVKTGATSVTSSTAFSVVGAALAPAAVIAGYQVISKYVGKAIENNSKLGQSYKELYDTWKEADSNAQHISALRDEYEQLNTSINSGELNSEQLEAAKNRTSAIIEEIKKLTNDETIKLMIDTGDYETALDMVVADAENAADEINNALNKNNYRDAQKAVFEAYDAISAGSGLGAQYKERRDSAQQWIQEATKFEEQYRKILNNTRKAEESGNRIGRRAFEKERNDLIKSMQESGFTDTYTALTGNDFKFEDMDGIIAQVQNVKNAYKELNDELTASDERAVNGRKSLQAMAQVAQDSAMELNGFDKIEEVFAAGGNAVNNTIAQLKANMSDWEFANEDIAAQVALFRNGFDSLQSAISNNALDAVIKDFVSDGEQLGLTSTQVVEKAALMKNGFTDVEQAISKGDISGVINDLGKLGGDMGMSVAQVDALAHSIGLIPEDKHIELTVNGYEVVEGTAEKLKELDTENVHVSVSADGDLTVLNQATGETKNLQELGAVSLQVNADGNIDVLNQAGEKVAEIQDNPSATITVNTELEETTEDTTVTVDADAEPAKEKISALNQEQVKVPVDANTDAADAKIKSLSQTVEVTTHYTATGDVPKGRAKGDMNFPGGLAMVNDERGISDNRELIVDRGRAFIPEGRDVILPLSKGAKVYTAAQTKAIMSGLGIPHYAKGKDNSDAFIAAKNDWADYKNTHAVTLTQELQKWVELLEKFTSNQKDVQDIQEQIFSLMQKQTKELNDQAKAYLEERSALNDWEDIGDSPLAAFGRVKERNMEEVRAGRQTWDDFTKTMKDMGSDMYNARISQSKKWLDHEEKYNGMSVADTLAGIDRMRSYTQEYYEQGIISHREFVESKTDLDEMYIDKVKEGLSEQFDISKAYISDHTYFNDWQDSGDDPLEAYNRVMDRHRESLANGDLTQKEFDEYSQKLGSSMYSERKEQSLNWLEEQRKYFGMTDEEYVQGLERIKAYTQEYYDQGLISRREYNEAMTELNHSAWDEASDAYDDMLKEQQDYINKMQEEFQKQEQALRDSWTVEDRKIDMAEVAGQLDIYAGAVTDRGQQKYKELEEQMKQLQRDEELYQLQVKNTATLDALKTDYGTAEDMKADFLRNIVTNTDINVSGIVGELTSKIAGSSNDITNMLGQLLQKLDNFKVENNSMTDNRKFSYNISQMTPEQIQEMLSQMVGR